MSSRNSRTPSTGCSRGWRHRSAASAGSSPTPRTSCAPRWPGSGSSARSPWPTRALRVPRSAPPTNGSWPPAPSRTSSSTPCSTLARGQAGLDTAGAVRPGRGDRPGRWRPARPRRGPAADATRRSARHRSPAARPGRTNGREPGRQRPALQRRGRPCRGHHRDPRTAGPSCRCPTPGPRSRRPRSSGCSSRSSGWPRSAEPGRPRPGTVDRAGDRRGARRQHHRRPRPEGGLVIEVAFPR